MRYPSNLICRDGRRHDPPGRLAPAQCLMSLYPSQQQASDFVAAPDGSIFHLSLHRPLRRSDHTDHRPHGPTRRSSARTRPTTESLFGCLSFMTCHERILFLLSVDSGLASKDVDSAVGDMLSMQLAEAEAHRSITREAQFRTAVALDVACARGCDSLESRMSSCCPVLPGRLWFAECCVRSPRDARR